MGSPDVFISDVASTAKRGLLPGGVLDGEGGYGVSGRLVAGRESVSGRYLPLGLSRGAKMVRTVARDAFVTYDDGELDETSLPLKVRRV